MHQSLLKEVAAQLNQQPHNGGMVNNAAFCQACDASGLPLSHAECFMLGQLLTRRKPNTAGEWCCDFYSCSVFDFNSLDR